MLGLGHNVLMDCQNKATGIDAHVGAQFKDWNVEVNGEIDKNKQYEVKAVIEKK